MQEKPLYKREWIQLAVLLLLFAAATAFVQIEKGVAVNEIDWTLVVASTFFAAMRTLGKSGQDAAKTMRDQMPQPSVDHYPNSPFRAPTPAPTPAPQPRAPVSPAPAAPHGEAGMVVPVPGVPTDVEMTDVQRRAEIQRLEDMQAKIEGRVATKLEGDQKIVGRDGA